jgi:cell division protein ZapA
MSNITLSIAGHSFAVACAEGEEEHVRGLGKMIDDKLSALPNASAQSEARMLLFASLLLADEVHELRQSPAPAASASEEPDFAPQLEAMADRFENLATLLESSAGTA